jgi:acetoacetyl-CoA synthetase
MADELTLLWQPNEERLAKAKITAYMASLAQGGRHFSNYEELWQWSVDDLQGFWQSIWDYFDVKSSHPYQQVLANASMPGAAWFEGAKLNFAEQIFRFNTEGQAKNKIAIIAESETRDRVEMTWGQLHTQITAVANTLRAMGVQPGDRVVAYLPNIPETVVIFYACASIGAIWSSCSPDMGHSSVLDRFKQIDPKVLIAVDGYRYGGKEFNRLSIVDTMRHELTTLEHTILLPYLDQHATLPDAMPWSSLFSHPAAQLKEMQFEQVAFNHPLWILYSSGTTGMPKPIVHS